MGLEATTRQIGTEKQTINIATVPPTVGLIVAPPPPSGPKGIPTPFPVFTDTKKIVKKPANKVVHKNKKLCTVKTQHKGIKGDEAAISSLPPGTPKKDVISGVKNKHAECFTGNSSVKLGGKACCFVSSMGYGNVK